jgi:hypothetical protein
MPKETVDYHDAALAALDQLPDTFRHPSFQRVTGFRRTKANDMLRWLIEKEFLTRRHYGNGNGYDYFKEKD